MNSVTLQLPYSNQKSVAELMLYIWIGFALGLAPMSIMAAENWPHWRGPYANGSAPLADPPTTWDGVSGKNIKWRAELVGLGSATPIIWGEQIFIASCEPTNQPCGNAGGTAESGRSPPTAA